MTDESLWLVKDKGGSLVALMIVYVDDIGLFGPRPVLETLVLELNKKWRLSEPSWATSSEQVSFGGEDPGVACRSFFKGIALLGRHRLGRA